MVLIMIPSIKNETTVVLGIVVFLISRKYIKGTVNSRSNVIPIARLSELLINSEDFAIKIINAIIRNGIPNMIRFF